VEHIREVVGIEYVGIGADYDGCDVFPAELTDVSTYPVLFAELLARGWSEQDCAKVAGENVLRALREAESTARRLQQERRPSLARIETLDGPTSAPAQPG
jgi:membrane dipeptidase